MLDLAGCDWVRQKKGVFVIGQTGVDRPVSPPCMGHRTCLGGLGARYCAYRAITGT